MAETPRPITFTNRQLDLALVGLSAAFVASQAHIVRLLGPVAPRGLRLQTTLSATTFRGILEGFTPAELARYRSHLPPDFVHPLLYAGALLAGVARLDRARPLPPALRRVLATAPVVAAAGDYVENLAHLYLMAHRDRITARTVAASGLVTNTKWITSLGTFGYLAQAYGTLATTRLSPFLRGSRA